MDGVVRYLILHGRRICRPRPLLRSLRARDLCRYYDRSALRAAEAQEEIPLK